ncbi:formin-like protein 5 [Sapajus apella]|uniref:Formin-like protein 5 n=1 Tax=Sapajus apella TaxID=9515 RepID=A0A6J3FUC0_SAPAP|nr:formin-like protein 5 [Sapajus apella]
MTLGNTNPGALPPCARLSASPGSSQPPARPTSFLLPRLGPESRKTRPLPPDPPESAPPTPGLFRPALAQRIHSPPGRERADASSAPTPRPLPSRGSGFTHGCPELLRAARAGSRRSRLARPSPAPRGSKRGRQGRDSSAGTLLGPGPRPPPAPGRCAFPRPPHSSSRRSLACLFWGPFSVEFLHST